MGDVNVWANRLIGRDRELATLGSVLVLHGDDDQIVPIDALGRLSVQIVECAELKVYPDAPHGLVATPADQFNADLLDFARPEST